MKKLLTVTGVIIVVVLGAYSQRANIAARLMEKGLESRMGADRVATLEDGLHLALCGAGAPRPPPMLRGPAWR